MAALNRKLTLHDIRMTVRDAYSSLRICKGVLNDPDRLEPLRAELNTRSPLGRLLPDGWSRTAKGRPRYDSWTRGFAAGLIEAEWNQIMHNEVEFCYRHPDRPEVLFSTHKESVHRKTEEFYERNAGPELNDYESAHVWKGTNKSIDGKWMLQRTKQLQESCSSDCPEQEQ